MLTRIAVLLVIINLIFVVFSTSLSSPTAIYTEDGRFARNDEICMQDPDYLTSVQKFLCATSAFERDSKNIDVTQIFGDWIKASLAFIEIFATGGGIADIAGVFQFESIKLITKIIYTAIIVAATISFISNRYV